MLIERVLLRVDQLCAVHFERRHPIRIIAIDVPHHADEFLLIRSARDLPNRHVTHFFFFFFGAFPSTSLAVASLNALRLSFTFAVALRDAAMVSASSFCVASTEFIKFRYRPISR